MQDVASHLSGTKPRLFPPLLHRKKKDVTLKSTEIPEVLDVVRLGMEEALIRRLATDITQAGVTSPATPDLSVAVSAYFGSGLSNPVDWCTPGPGKRCGERDAADPITIHMLPWMNDREKGYDRCAT